MNTEFVSKLKALRIEKKLTQKEVSNLLGMSPNAYMNYERGHREPSMAVLKQLCIIFEVSADYLLGLSDF